MQRIYTNVLFLSFIFSFISYLRLHVQDMQIGAQVGRKHDLEEQVMTLNNRLADAGILLGRIANA